MRSNGRWSKVESQGRRTIQRIFSVARKDGKETFQGESSGGYSSFQDNKEETEASSNNVLRNTNSKGQEEKEEECYHDRDQDLEDEEEEIRLKPHLNKEIDQIYGSRKYSLFSSTNKQQMQQQPSQLSSSKQPAQLVSPSSCYYSGNLIYNPQKSKPLETVKTLPQNYISTSYQVPLSYSQSLSGFVKSQRQQQHQYNTVELNNSKKSSKLINFTNLSLPAENHLDISNNMSIKKSPVAAATGGITTQPTNEIQQSVNLDKEKPLSNQQKALEHVLFSNKLIQQKVQRNDRHRNNSWCDFMLVRRPHTGKNNENSLKNSQIQGESLFEDKNIKDSQVLHGSGQIQLKLQCQQTLNYILSAHQRQKVDAKIEALKEKAVSWQEKRDKEKESIKRREKDQETEKRISALRRQKYCSAIQKNMQNSLEEEVMHVGPNDVQTQLCLEDKEEKDEKEKKKELSGCYDDYYFKLVQIQQQKNSSQQERNGNCRSSSSNSKNNSNYFPLKQYPSNSHQMTVSKSTKQVQLASSSKVESPNNHENHDGSKIVAYRLSSRNLHKKHISAEINVTFMNKDNTNNTKNQMNKQQNDVMQLKQYQSLPTSPPSNPQKHIEDTISKDVKNQRKGEGVESKENNVKTHKNISPDPEHLYFSNSTSYLLAPKNKKISQSIHKDNSSQETPDAFLQDINGLIRFQTSHQIQRFKKNQLEEKQLLMHRGNNYNNVATNKILNYQQQLPPKRVNLSIQNLNEPLNGMISGKKSNNYFGQDLQAKDRHTNDNAGIQQILQQQNQSASTSPLKILFQ